MGGSTNARVEITMMTTIIVSLFGFANIFLWGSFLLPTARRAMTPIWNRVSSEPVKLPSQEAWWMLTLINTLGTFAVPVMMWFSGDHSAPWGLIYFFGSLLLTWAAITRAITSL